MLSALTVAEYLLGLVCQDEGDLMSNLKLQKLLYYTQGFHLAMDGKPLFSEQIEAWKHGPVVPNVYHKYKEFGRQAIPCPTDTKAFDKIPLKSKEVINDVYEVYGQYEASVLRNLTHGEPPWQKTEEGAVISQDLMKEYFKTQVSHG